MKRLWKKPAVKISAAAVVVVGFALLMLWIWSLRTPPLMSFDFLAGRSIKARSGSHPGKSHYRRTTEIYSFEANFCEVVRTADLELPALGFEIDNSAAAFFKNTTVRGYLLPDAASGEATFVIILDRCRFVKFPIMQSSGPSTADSFAWTFSDGWVTVQISRSHLRLWPPQHLLYRLKMRWRASGRQKS